MTPVVRTVFSAGSLILILLWGCAEKRVAAWTPKPEVQWEHVSTLPVRPAQEGYRILTDGATHGLFPAAMGVTRVAVAPPSENAPTPGPYLLADPRNEFLQWNSALDDQMAISEVFPITERDLGGRQADPEQVLAAFRALRGRLGLIYAVNERSGTETEMFGVLYDTSTARAVASLHAAAVSVIAPDGEEDAAVTDPWTTDSRAVVRAKFEDLLRACVRELIEQDEPPSAEAPTGWTPAGPMRPVEWPPKRFRTGG